MTKQNINGRLFRPPYTAAAAKAIYLLHLKRFTQQGVTIVGTLIHIYVQINEKRNAKYLLVRGMRLSV